MKKLQPNTQFPRLYYYMLLTFDSSKYHKLLSEINGMFRYEEAADQYDAGVRDGRNEAIGEVKIKLSDFWAEITR